MFENYKKNQVHQIFSFATGSSQSSCFLTLLARDTVQSVSILRLRDTEISKGVCPPRESVTVQHLLGTDWTRLWSTCAGMANHSSWSAWNNSRSFAGAFALPWTRLSSSSRTCSTGFKSGDIKGRGRIWTLLFARNCVVRFAVWGVALSCWNTAPYVWCPE